MQISTNYLQKFEKSENKKINSERAEILCQILQEVNRERTGTWKPLSGKLLAIRLSHIPTKDLFFLLSQGKDYKARKGSFGKFLFGSLKVKT